MYHLLIEKFYLWTFSLKISLLLKIRPRSVQDLSYWIDEISELSNEQLALLANVVANEIDQLTSQVDNWQEVEQDEGPQEVELIEIPVEVIEETPPEPIVSQ